LTALTVIVNVLRRRWYRRRRWRWPPLSCSITVTVAKPFGVGRTAGETSAVPVGDDRRACVLNRAIVRVC